MIAAIQSLLVQDVQLLCRRILLQELACYFALCCQYNSIFGKDAYGGTGMCNGFKGILYLIETAFGGEDGGLRSWSEWRELCKAGGTGYP
jgi:hypothetical protein